MRLIKNGIVYINRKLEFYITADSESPESGYKELDKGRLDKLCKHVDSLPVGCEEYRKFESLIKGIIEYERRVRKETTKTD